MTRIDARWSAPAHVRAFTTTRLGGVSQPPYDRFNLGLHVGDAPEAVLENRRRLVDDHGLPGTPTWLRQVHGTEIRSLDAGALAAAPADASAADAVADPPADGAWTAVPGRVAAVMTADCLPVVLSDARGTRVAVVHAGWRGLAAGVLDKAVAVFESGAPLHAWFGPAIGPRAFEVGEEVRDAFVRRNAAFGRAFVPASSAAGKYLADLYELARIALRSQADVRCSGGDLCTFEDASLFYSHRRDGAASGRMATVAWLERSDHYR